MVARSNDNDTSIYTINPGVTRGWLKDDGELSPDSFLRENVILL